MNVRLDHRLLQYMNSKRLLHLSFLIKAQEFNVVRGLEDIGLEESRRGRRLLQLHDNMSTLGKVFKQMRACADSVARRER